LDASFAKQYTLSEPTRQLLADLKAPVDVVVLLGSADPLLVDLRHLVTAYQAVCPQLRVKYIDPDRDIAEFLALGRKHDIGAESDHAAGTIADTAVFLQSGARS
jgi:hypothetical protein